MNYITLMRGEVEKAQSLNTLVKALEEAKENKYVDAVYLESGVGNHNAHAFFEHHGFSMVSHVFRLG